MSFKNEILFPLQVVDNFFDNPKKIIKFANSLEYKNETGEFPGVRSELLNKIDYNFFNQLMIRILSLFFDLGHTRVEWKHTQAFFQKTYPFDPKQKDHILNQGIIHQDGDYPFVGLIYLTEDAYINSGTSIFSRIKKDNKFIYSLEKKRRSLYKKCQDKLTPKDLKTYEDMIEKINSNYVETCRFNNVCNRLITYAGNEYHRANNFYTGKKERLMLVFFIQEIRATGLSPLQRIKNRHVIK
jgi:hypothetical protein